MTDDRKTNPYRVPKRRRKTIEQRFEDWWERCGARHYTPDQIEIAHDFARAAYINGWHARTRTPR